jgi:2-C-methyl-D-erythritol 4-phosphate cytidylyltransferase
MRTVAAVMAVGAGRRAGAAGVQPLESLAGRAIIEHSLAAFEAAPGTDEIVVVIGPELTAQVDKRLSENDYRKVSRVIEGGRSYAESVLRAVQAIDAPECNILLHDAARPLVGQRVIADCILALETHDAACAAIPSSDTVVAVENGLVSERPPRDRLRRRQTPQGFRLSVLRRAYQLGYADPAAPATDACGTVLHYLPETEVVVVAGSERNIEITSPADVAIAETLLAS